MRRKDIILAAICGLSVSWIAIDFLGELGWIFVVIFPALAVAGFLLCDIFGKKYLFIRQAGKFSLAGAFADVVDIKIFQLFFLFLNFSLVCKVISFLAGTFVKYFSDKYWTFEKYEKENMHKEMGKFFTVAIVGSLINVVSFYFFGKIRVGLPAKVWTEMCVILAALATAAWNFCGYKFIVFKK